MGDYVGGDPEVCMDLREKTIDMRDRVIETLQPGQHGRFTPIDPDALYDINTYQYPNSEYSMEMAENSRSGPYMGETDERRPPPEPYPTHSTTFTASFGSRFYKIGFWVAIIIIIILLLLFILLLILKAFSCNNCTTEAGDKLYKKFAGTFVVLYASDVRLNNNKSQDYRDTKIIYARKILQCFSGSALEQEFNSTEVTNLKNLGLHLEIAFHLVFRITSSEVLDLQSVRMVLQEAARRSLFQSSAFYGQNVQKINITQLNS